MGANTSNSSGCGDNATDNGKPKKCEGCGSTNRDSGDKLVCRNPSKASKSKVVAGDSLLVRGQVS
jgi:hypothetical protein